MKNEQHEIIKEHYEITLENGLFLEKVIAEFRKDYLDSVGFHHLEFHGKATSHTGYYSHFFNADFDEIDPIDAIIKITEQISGMKVKSIFFNSEYYADCFDEQMEGPIEQLDSIFSKTFVKQ